MVLADEWKGRIGAGIWLGAYLVACGLFIAGRGKPVFVSILVIFAVVGAARRLHEIVRGQLSDEQLSPLGRLLWLALLPALGALLVLVYLVGRRDGWGFFGFAVFYLGFGLIAERLRDKLERPEVWGLRLLGVSLAAVVVGLVTMALFGSSVGMRLAIVGLLTIPVGLSLVSEARLQSAPQDGRVRLVAQVVVGALLFLGGLLLVALDVNDTYVTLLGVALFVLVLAIAARSNTDTMLVVVLAAVAWALSHQTAPVTAAVKATEGEPAIVALGDSYISGEGADQFFEGTNAKGDNECRRAPTAYPALLVHDEHAAIPEDLHLVFLACSGAKTDGVSEQLDEFRAVQGYDDIDIEFVLLSVGGNDALFGSVAKTCLLPGDCSELGPAWIDNLRRVRASLDDLYAEVRETFPDTPVLAVPYPIPISERHCSSSGFTRDEHQFLHDFTIALNEVVADAAAAAGFHVVSTMPNALTDANARLCDERGAQVGVNFLEANSVIGTLEQASYPLNWFHNSLHPNEYGHNLMRTSVLAWLDGHPDFAEPLEPVEDEEGSETAAAGNGDGTCQGRYGGDLDRCTNRWMIEQLGRRLLFGGPLALGIVLGAWLLVIPLITLWRMVFAEDDG